MREIFDVSISKGGGSDICVSGQPGYLELTEDQKARLICTEPIEDHYEVEDEPFARYVQTMTIGKFGSQTIHGYEMSRFLFGFSLRLHHPSTLR
ncbi:hypothetical protein M8J75_011245 [Diaphorina citri]|nr:hypothetical protein M8J75_011245 [Diaphorina citri]